MRSPSISSRNNSPRRAGFTLIEILIALSIMTAVMLLGVYLGLDALHASYSRSERDTLVSLLTQARSRSMANIDESAWGVCVSGSEYVVFEGSACDEGAATSESTPLGPGASVSGIPQATPVIFTAVSGTATPAAITVTQQGRTSAVSINYEGAIIW